MQPANQKSTPTPSDADRARAANRARYPEFAAFVDNLRRVFGEVKVTRIEEVR